MDARADAYRKYEEILKSQDYLSFRSTVPQKKVCVEEDKDWVVYDAGPKTVRCPLVFLPPASGTADIFFRQLLALSSLGYRVLSVEYPVYWNVRDWCDGFLKLMDSMQLDKVHIFGASLGGFLAQKFAEFTEKQQRVASLLLCNAFTDTAVFQQTVAAHTFWLVPALMLKKMVMGNFEKGLVDGEIADSVDFMVDKLEGLTQAQLASRLTLNCLSSYVEPQKLSEIPITLVDVYDKSALSQTVREETYKCYPDAKRAHLKSGGNFPYLSRADEVNVYVRIHIQPFEGSRYSPVV